MKTLLSLLLLIPSLSWGKINISERDGLFSSTLLNLIVTPLVFWRFGEKASQSYLEQQTKQRVL